MGRFELDFLEDLSDDALLNEMRRVAASHSAETLTKKSFVALSGRVSASTICKRFRGWKNALEAAGLGHLYSGVEVTEKMRRNRAARQMSDEELLAEIRRIKSVTGRNTISAREFAEFSVVGVDLIRGRFGTWPKALAAAGVDQSNHAKRYSDEECFENLANVWTHYGRVPHYQEMKRPPSLVGSKAYIVRWGTWRKSLKAFVGWANAESAETLATPAETPGTPIDEAGLPARPKPRSGRPATEADRREVRPGLRFKVFSRDRFRCVSCGRSPATHLGIELHADHIVSVNDDGKTVMENLQTLCMDCNLGKGKTSIR